MQLRPSAAGDPYVQSEDTPGPRLLSARSASRRGCVSAGGHGGKLCKESRSKGFYPGKVASSNGSSFDHGESFRLISAKNCIQSLEDLAPYPLGSHHAQPRGSYRRVARQRAGGIRKMRRRYSLGIARVQRWNCPAAITKSYDSYILDQFCTVS